MNDKKDPITDELQESLADLKNPTTDKLVRFLFASQAELLRTIFDINERLMLLEELAGINNDPLTTH